MPLHGSARFCVYAFFFSPLLAQFAAFVNGFAVHMKRMVEHDGGRLSYL